MLVTISMSSTWPVPLTNSKSRFAVSNTASRSGLSVDFVM